MASTCRTSPADLERQAILEQLERLLGDRLFKNSRRYPSLLRHVVMETLDGRGEQLKERNVGASVFGREADYDTNLDPVVRVTAGEIRKRIARYYETPEHKCEVRIDLPAGSYIPEFHLPAAPVEEQTVAVAPPVVAAPARRFSLRAAAALFALVLLAVAAWFQPWRPTPALTKFWAPILESPGPVLFCVGQVASDGQPGAQAVLVPGPDVEMLSALIGFLAARNKPYSVRGKSRTTLSDLREGPAVLVGAFNNDWTMRFLSRTRFGFRRNGSLLGIEDRRNPSQTGWMLDPSTAINRDYGLISRMLDPDTDRVVLVAAGILRHGTAAAGEFLTNPKYMDAVAKQAPPGWEGRNLQIVISTNVITGNSAPPQVVATHFW